MPCAWKYTETAKKKMIRKIYSHVANIKEKTQNVHSSTNLEYINSNDIRGGSYVHVLGCYYYNFSYYLFIPSHNITGKKI